MPFQPSRAVPTVVAFFVAVTLLQHYVDHGSWTSSLVRAGIATVAWAVLMTAYFTWRRRSL